MPISKRAFVVTNSTPLSRDVIKDKGKSIAYWWLASLLNTINSYYG